MEAKWLKIINDRPNTDRITATKIKIDKTNAQLVDETWKEALKKAKIPHQNWLQHQEVFSG